MTTPIDPLDQLKGQIIRLYADVATVQVGDAPVECAIRGKLFKADPPAVGDYVALEESGEGYVISGLLPRKSALTRRAAGSTVKSQVLMANIDQVMLVFAAANPPITPAKIDRFLVVAEANRLQAQIIVNKMDLAVGPVEAEIRSLFRPYEQADYEVHYASVRTGEGLEEVRQGLVGKVSVLVGPSGVGKSSLLNALYPGLDLKVGQVSEAYGKGRHTTVGGYLINLPGGAQVADTAGLREIGLWMVPPEELPYCFPEFQPYLGECRFNDCAHLTEPGCAILEALNQGKIDLSRHESYTKLRAEAVETFPRW